jgi:hypothetical protein
MQLAFPRPGTTTFACRASPKPSNRTSTYADSASSRPTGAETGKRIRSITVGNEEGTRHSDEEIVLAALGDTADDELTSFAPRRVLTDHVGIPRETTAILSRRPRLYSLSRRRRYLCTYAGFL